MVSFAQPNNVFTSKRSVKLSRLSLLRSLSRSWIILLHARNTRSLSPTKLTFSLFSRHGSRIYWRLFKLRFTVTDPSGFGNPRIDRNSLDWKCTQTVCAPYWNEALFCFGKNLSGELCSTEALSELLRPKWNAKLLIWVICCLRKANSWIKGFFE